MERLVTQFASAEAHAADKADLFGSLGIDWKLLILQSVAFLILLFVLSKWVYPPLAAMLDKREKDLRTAEKAAKSARENADKTEKMINASMRKARAEARDIVASARNEATEIVEPTASSRRLGQKLLAKLRLRAKRCITKHCNWWLRQPAPW